MNIAHLLARAARAWPNNPALYIGERLLCDYRSLADRVARIAGFLRHGAGLNPGDRVALYMANSPAYLELLYAVWWAGLAAVPVNAKLHPKEALFILDDSASQALVVADDAAADPLLARAQSVKRVLSCRDADYAAMLGSAPLQPEHRAPEDLAWLFYTSGTTGRPKGVVETHRMILAATAGYFTDIDAVAQHDSMVYAAPLSHGAGLYNFPHMLRGARHVVPESGGFDPAELAGLARSLKNISLFAAPTMVKRLVDHMAGAQSDADGFKTIVYGGGPMYLEDIKRALAVMGNRFVQIYGQGESPMTITALSRAVLADSTHPRWERRIASVGIAQSLVEVRVAGPDGAALPDGEAGEVLVRGDVVMTSYWRNPEATSNTVRDGWLWTGDIGSLDADGFLTLKDRSKDVIISGGSNIYPREVEEALLRHPAVAEVSVVGRPNPEWGEDVVAFVVCRPGTPAAVAELDACCIENIARFKRPKEYRFIESLPKNNYGKVLKTELRLLLESAPSDNQGVGK
ncbi:MAG: long-chain fatty acid--CoA ligase [Betaproteobacteria bacterium]|nr:long-chain fatty acid--CoA ligase [Betaproteobacteria bacterium]